MKMWTLLNEENRIVMVTVQKQNDEQFEYEFPSDFAFPDIINYKIIDGELVYDEMPIPEPEPEEDEGNVIEDYLGDILMNQVQIIKMLSDK